MNLIIRRMSVCLCVVCILGIANFANSSDITSKLKYVRDIEVKGEIKDIAAVHLDRDVYEHIDDFSDIRVVGVGKEEIPFRIRKQHGKKKEVRRVICSSKVISLKKLDENRIEIVLKNRDAKRTPRFLTIRTSNRNYDKKVSIANGRSIGKWGTSKEGQAVFDYSAIINLSNNTVSLPKKGRGKYYKIVISNFSEQKQSKRMEVIEERRAGKDFSEIKKMMRLNDDFKIDRLVLEAEERVYHDKAAVTRLVDTELLSNEEKKKKTEIVLEVFCQPIVRLEIETLSTNFSREIEILGSKDKKEWRSFAHCKISKIKIGSYNKSNLKVSIPETRYRYLKLVIDNGDAPALEVTEVKCSENIYNAEFLLPSESYGIKMYYGGDLSAPKYDIDEILAKIANPEYTYLKLGVERDNSSYSDQPEEKSFLDSKVLMYVIIGVMVLVLGAALFSGMKKIEDSEDSE